MQGQEAASHSVLAVRKLSVSKKGSQTIRSQGPPPVTHFPNSEDSTILPNNTTCWGPVFKHVGLWGTSLPSEDFVRLWRKNVVDYQDNQAMWFDYHTDLWFRQKDKGTCTFIKSMGFHLPRLNSEPSLCQTMT